MEGRAGPLGRLERLLVRHYNAWIASNTPGLGGDCARGRPRLFLLKGRVRL